VNSCTHTEWKGEENERRRERSMKKEGEAHREGGHTRGGRTRGGHTDGGGNMVLRAHQRMAYA
jgi:hypothetical protein